MSDSNGGPNGGGGGGSNKGTLDPRERYHDPNEADRMKAEAAQSRIWTAMPIILRKHDLDKNTVHGEPAIKLQHLKGDGTTEWKPIPKMEDLPVLYYGGGGASITNPSQDGDEALMITASRSIDKWWSEGKVQEQLHARMHDISDSFVIPGLRSQPRKLKDVSAKTWQLRTDDGKSYVELDPTNARNFKVHIENTVTIESVNGDVLISAKGKVNITAPQITLVAQNRVRMETPLLEVTGKITAGGDVVAGHAAGSASAMGETPEPYSGGIPSTPGALIGAALNTAETAIDTWEAIKDGSFQVAIDGVQKLVTNLDFTGITSLHDVASHITSALQLGDTFGTMAWNTIGRFNLTSGTVGIGSLVGFVSAIPGVGKDISIMLKMVQGMPGVITVAGLRGSISVLEHLHQKVKGGPNNTGTAT
jgi:hypothetical protein